MLWRVRTSRAFDRLNRRRERGFYGSVVGVTALGRRQLEIARQRAGNRDVPSRLIYNSIHVDEFRRAMGGACAMGLPEKEGGWVWCVYAGSLIPSYDIPTVVECARRCEEDGRRILFVVAGAGEYGGLCRRGANGHLLYLGTRGCRVSRRSR